MAIRKILNGKLVEMRPIPTGYKSDVCKTCALANEKVQCTTMDITCMDYPDENWVLVEEDPTSTEIEGQKYWSVPGESEEGIHCLDCVAKMGSQLCEALQRLMLCDNRYWIEDENPQENNQ